MKWFICYNRMWLHLTIFFSLGKDCSLISENVSYPQRNKIVRPSFRRAFSTQN